MHNIYVHNILYIVSMPTFSSVLIIPTYREHQNKDYAHRTVQIVYVYTATKQRASTCFNY